MEKKEWILIDSDFRRKLPKEDCEIWITRVCCFHERWVQKVDYFASTRNIEWDGTIAWMKADEGEETPTTYSGVHNGAIQMYR